jgi:hypothetical protein
VLDLDAPDWVEAETAPTNADTFPTWSMITYHFPAKGRRGPIKMVWYDGGKLPPRPAGLEAERALGDNGIYFVGTKGVLLAPGWSGPPRLVPESKMAAFERPAKTIPRSVGHHRQPPVFERLPDPFQSCVAFFAVIHNQAPFCKIMPF